MTPDMIRAFETLSTLTLGNSQRAKDEKAALILEIQERQLLNVDMLRNFRTVYPCSHVDIRLPLLLGARKIDLVDPYFMDPHCVVTVINIIEKITGRRVEATLRGLHFQFDFGEGPEDVEVRCLAQRYHTGNAEEARCPWKVRLIQDHEKEASTLFSSHQGVSVYTTTESLGLLLGFANYGVTFDCDRYVIDALVPGGTIISIPGPYEDLDINPLEALAMMGLPKRQWERLIASFYCDEGKYEFIALQSEIAEPIRYSFLRKI